MSRSPEINIGSVFGFWTVVGRDKPVGHGICRKWICLCRCGTKRSVSGPCLKEGRSRSCGCMHYGRPKRVGCDPDETAFLGLLGYYRSSAKRRGYTFELSETEFRERTKMCCIYCGAKPGQVAWNSSVVKYRKGKYIYNGLDRLDPKQGYTPQNSAPCCGRCNEMKMSDSINEFLMHIGRIAAYSSEWIGVAVGGG